MKLVAAAGRLPDRYVGLGTDRRYPGLLDAAPVSARSGIPLMAALGVLPRLPSMTAEHSTAIRMWSTQMEALA